MLLGLFGAALLYGDGMITPAISVLSAIEGLSIATPALGHFVVPLTIAILVGLFVLQQRGTARIGALFGPVMIVWFAVLAVLGIASLVRAPEVLAAVDPRHARPLLRRAMAPTGSWSSARCSSCVTGGEALYADMGHFGRRPIRIAWFALVLPALLLNYFGQGALLLREPAAAANPFYHLAPAWALYPLVVLATAATVIASQAIIAGPSPSRGRRSSSGCSPACASCTPPRRRSARSTFPSSTTCSSSSTVALVLGFRTSTRLAAAYGVAVTGTMVITTLLAFMVDAPPLELEPAAGRRGGRVLPRDRPRRSSPRTW